MPDRRVLVVASRRRDPPELFLLALCLLTAASGLFGAQPPSSVQAVMPSWLVTGWYVMLGAAGAVGVLGNLWPGRGQLATAWRLRLAGQLFAAGPAAAYAVAAFAYAGGRALVAGALVVVWALICTWQAALLARDLRRLDGAR